MAFRQESEHVAFDADGATDWLVDELGDDLRAVAEYSPGDYSMLYVSDDVLEEYGGMEAVDAVGDSVHQYIELDFQEREMFVDLFPPMDEVDGFVTVSEGVVVARVLTPDDQGLYFSTRVGVPAAEVVSELADRIEA